MSRKTGRPSLTRSVPSAGTRQRPPGQVWRAVTGLAAAAAIGVFIGVQMAGPSAAETSVAQLRRNEAQRDVAQIAELTTRARQTVKVVKPVVDGLAADAAAVTEAQVAQWKQLLAGETQWYATTVSGMTATNVARGGLRTAVGQLAAAVETYALARTAAEPMRGSLLQLASRQRDLAVTGWSVAATQLDQINVDAGNGHQHVYLDTAGVSGAMTGDNLPEGSKK